MLYAELKKIHMPQQHTVGVLKSGYYMRYVAKPLSLFLLKILIYLPFSANQVSILMILTGFVGALFIGFSNLALIGGILLQVAILLDAVDGSLARYKNKKTLFGNYIDKMFHNIVIPLLFFMLGVYTYSYYNNTTYIFMGFGIAFMIVSSRFGFLNKYEVLIKKGKISLIKKIDIRLVTKYRKNLIQRMAGAIIISMNRFTNIFTLFLIAKIFNFLHYLIFIYFPFYMVVGLTKIIIDFNSARKELNIKYD